MVAWAKAVPPFSPHTKPRSFVTPMQALWSKWLWWLYVPLLLGSGSALTDAYLPERTTTTTITHITRFEVDQSTKQVRNMVPWSVVTMADGTKFQAPGGNGSFNIGDTLILQTTALFRTVINHAPIHAPAYRTELFERDREYDAFPAVVLLCSCFLLIPFRAVEPRWYLHGILLLVCFGWLVTMIGLGGLKPWG